MPHLTFGQWILAVGAATAIGVSKSGLFGLSLFYIVIFALLFGARDSTGVILPMLLIGDISAVRAFRHHVRWAYLRRMLPPACLGVCAGAMVMSRLSDAFYRPLIGTIILGLTALHVIRTWRPAWFGDVPHARWFAWSVGIVAGVTTMLANAAGPIMALYSLAVALPKLELVGTNAWFFLLINTFKIPFSYHLGLIHGRTLMLNVTLAPAIVLGMAFGRWLTRRISQRWFDWTLLAFAAAAALRLIGVFG